MKPASQPTDPESHWITHVMRREQRQLTLRAALVGALIGIVMCLSNLYVFFKTGWSMGVTITAGILAFATFRLLTATRLTRTPLTILENNALTTVASGAGYMTGGGNMAAFGALLMVTAVRPDTAPMVLWFALIAMLGVLTAIPIKRQLINQEQLAFPTGTATAETLRALHGDAGGGAQEGAVQARALAFSGLFAGGIALLRDLKVFNGSGLLPSSLPLPFEIAGKAAAKWTLSIKTEVVLIGAGALMNFRTGWSLLLGSILTYAVLAPSLVAQGLISEPSYKAIVAYTVWPGAALLVASGLTSFALGWKSIVRSFSGFGRLFGRGGGQRHPIDDIECPAAWFPIGFVILAPLVVLLMVWLFQIPWWAGVIAVPLSLVMGFVAARVTGETDVTPTKALGPVTQLLYGVITPGNLGGNIMSANVTGGIGLHAADLLTTLKTGWLLGGNPRVQFWAQMIGVFVGAAIIVPAFTLLIPDPAALGGEDWPAPSCLVWAGVSEAFANGIDALHPWARSGIVIGLVLGVGLALLEHWAPKKLKAYIPSASGLGIAMVVPGSNGIAMFLGSGLAEWFRRAKPALAARIAVPIASGLIAGESLMGVLIAVLTASKVI